MSLNSSQLAVLEGKLTTLLANKSMASLTVAQVDTAYASLTTEAKTQLANNIATSAKPTSGSDVLTAALRNQMTNNAKVSASQIIAAGNCSLDILYLALTQ